MLSPLTCQQLEHYCKNRMTIDWQKSKRIVDVDYFAKRYYEIIVEEKEFESLECKRLYVKNRQRTAYDIFEIYIPQLNKWFIAIQEKYREGLKVKIIGDIESINQIKAMKYETKNNDINDLIELRRFERENYTNISYCETKLKEYIENPNYLTEIEIAHNINKLNERLENIENQLSYIEKCIEEKEEKISKFARQIIKQINIPENGEYIHNHIEKISKETKLSYNSIWYKYYIDKYESLKIEKQKLENIEKELGI